MSGKTFPMDTVTLKTSEDELRRSFCLICDESLFNVKSRGACSDRASRVGGCPWRRHFKSLERDTPLSDRVDAVGGQP